MMTESPYTREDGQQYMNKRSSLFCKVAQCQLAVCYRRFGSIFKGKDVLDIFRLRKIPEARRPQLQGCESLKSRTLLTRSVETLYPRLFITSCRHVFITLSPHVFIILRTHIFTTLCSNIFITPSFCCQ
jgi:hypothetical protein